MFCRLASAIPFEWPFMVGEACLNKVGPNTMEIFDTDIEFSSSCLTILDAKCELSSGAGSGVGEQTTRQARHVHSLVEMSHKVLHSRIIRIRKFIHAFVKSYMP